VRRYQEAVYRVAVLIARETILAEDATQSTFVRAYRALPSFDAGLGLVPWLLRIAAGEARQQRRESGRLRQSSRPVERITGPRYPASPVPGSAQARSLSPTDRTTLGEAFDRLGEDDRLTLTLRYLLGMARQDAADALSVSVSVADERLTAALQHLRARMVDA
jgi:RNA polymerase sigma factor (sigma-70 family)